MATPTPGPSSNTPQKHLVPFSSPAPRSVPHTGNTGMINYDSPAVLNMLNEGSIGMGISMSGMGMSQLGLSASAMGRADEEERRRRLQTIIDTLKERPGRVGEEGIIALCKKMGVDVEKMMDEEGLTLIIGNEAMCDIFIRNDEVENVKLQTALDDEKQRPDLQFGPAGSQILLKSLRPLPGQNKINVTLERFSQNLDKLLRLDKLGAPENGGVSCYHAIAGVYTSLRKLFEHEKKMALALLEANTPYASHKAEREVLCKKSGRPRLNGGLCLGLSLEYWMDRRHMIRGSRSSQSTSEKGKGKMNVDTQPADDYPEDTDIENNRIYSLTIECEASPSALFTPIRISNDWISSSIEKPADANDATQSLDNILLNTASIDWQEPKPTYLEASAPTADQDAMSLDSTPGRLPNIRFIAKFNPPLVVPLTVYISLHQAVGVEPNAQEFRATTFTGLALRPSEPDPGMMGTVGEHTHEIQSSRSVLVVDAVGKEKEKKHNLSLYVPKMEYSKTLESLPFAHPRQLVEILPTLRQYAFTTSLLQHSFYEKEHKPSQTTQANLPSPPLTPSNTDDAVSAIQLDVNLFYTPPAPRFTFHAPHPSNSFMPISNTATPASDILASLLSTSKISTNPPIHIQVDIHPNAELAISDQNILPPSLPLPDAPKDVDVDMDKAQESENKQKRLARALDVCGDFSIWGEWLRKEVAK